MKIAVLSRTREPTSIEIYRSHICEHLATQGVTVVNFSEHAPPPSKCDLLWDPGLAGNCVPLTSRLDYPIPIVATVHGAAWFTLPWRNNYASVLRAMKGYLRTKVCQRAWRSFVSKPTLFIAVSDYGKREISAAFGISEEKISVIYHGVDHKQFHPDQSHTSPVEHPFFLHISDCRPKKNVQRIIDAYRMLPQHSRPYLVLIIPGFYRQLQPESRIVVISRRLNHSELSAYYQNTLAFIFPSLHETFGLPIVEAMACGCPVITSNSTACREIAANAAILVDPYETSDITGAMYELCHNHQKRDSLARLGIERAAQFDWKTSAQAHGDLFHKIAAQK